ncbi:hypothetical protein H2200_006733 [Cladophialophora chaetospira]|uniref:UBX domain-containing protein n=1 Tax=Cladophialophora chaetospira TaxID=386627 RepID=A0AA38X8W1_9EURO|nr:hypothetical protein H2200_006733 [Cladophialophora chaetospira]
MPFSSLTLPRFQPYEDDIFAAAPVRDITPPSGLLSLPTSGISHLSEESEIMYSAGSSYFQSVMKAASDEELNFSDEFEENQQLQRQETDQAEAAFLGMEDAAVNKRSSKYNVKPPIGPPEQTTPSAIAALPRSGRKTASMSPRTRSSREVSETPDHDEATPGDDDDDAVEIDVNDNNEEGVLTERTLRRRTVQQTNPYKFDKHNFQAQKTGRVMTTKKLEKEVKQEVEGTERFVSRAPSPEAEENRSIFDPGKAAFKVRLDGFRGAATAISFKQCDHVGKLMDFIKESWEWKYNGASFSHAIVSFSWLPAESELLLRPGSETSFERVVIEAERAPMWAEDGRCDIDVTVYVQ